MHNEYVATSSKRKPVVYLFFSPIGYLLERTRGGCTFTHSPPGGSFLRLRANKQDAEREKKSKRVDYHKSLITHLHSSDEIWRSLPPYKSCGAAPVCIRPSRRRTSREIVEAVAGYARMNHASFPSLEPPIIACSVTTDAGLAGAESRCIILRERSELQEEGKRSRGLVEPGCGRWRCEKSCYALVQFTSASREFTL